jgi:hypothetical protein
MMLYSGFTLNVVSLKPLPPFLREQFSPRLIPARVIAL